MKLTCKNCHQKFSLSPAQNTFFQASKQKGMTFAMFECPHCKRHFDTNPSKGKREQEPPPWRTPIAGVIGYVSLIEDEQEGTFYGCGETGEIWRTEEAFFKDIEQIIATYPHRKYCYQKTGNQWESVSNEPLDIEELILNEVKT